MSQISRCTEHFPLRLPAGFRDRLKEVAAENGRSMNSEIVVLLKRTLFDPFDAMETKRDQASN